MTARFEPARHRRLVRYGAAAVSVATALLYFGIGVGVVKVGEAVGPDVPDLFLFGASAGGAFALGAVLLLHVDHRGLWLLGALLQVLVIAMYVAISSAANAALRGLGHHHQSAPGSHPPGARLPRPATTRPSERDGPESRALTRTPPT